MCNFSFRQRSQKKSGITSNHQEKYERNLMTPQLRSWPYSFKKRWGEGKGNKTL